MPAKPCWVYIMANPWSRVLYTGVTSDLMRRVWQHKQQATGFTARYNVTTLVYFEEHDGPTSAITREKQIKAWRREKKVELICTLNPDFKDLSDGCYE
jgi:putative endonuclease